MKKIAPLFIVFLFLSCVTVTTNNSGYRNNRSVSSKRNVTRKKTVTKKKNDVFKYGKWACLDKNLKEVFYVDARRVYPFKNGLARVYTYKYSFVNKRGEEVISNMKAANDFEGPVTWVTFTSDSRHSLIDKKGRVLTKRKFVRFNKFKPGINVCAIYDKAGRIAFVNTRGKMVVPFGKYVKKRYFHEGFCGVQDTRGMWGFLDKNGKLAIPCKFKLNDDFKEGLFLARKNGRVGFVNTKGKVVIPYRYKFANGFREGYARVSVTGNKRNPVLIDKKGRVAFRTKKGTIIKAEMKGMVEVCTNLRTMTCGWTNMKDQWVIRPLYRNPSTFQGGGREYPYSTIQKGRLVGIIDTSGKIVMTPKYRNVIFRTFQNHGYISVTNNYRDREFYTLGFKPIKPAGITVKQIRGHQTDPYLPFKNEKKLWGYLSLNGKVVVKPLYEKCDVFREGRSWMKKK